MQKHLFTSLIKSSSHLLLTLRFLGLFRSLSSFLFGSLGSSFSGLFGDLSNQFLFFNQESSSNSLLQSFSGNDTTVSSRNGLSSSLGSASSQLFGSVSFDTLQFFAGVTAFGDGTLFAGVLEGQFSAGGFDDFLLVGRGVPAQSSFVGDSLNHFYLKRLVFSYQILSVSST